MGEAINLVNNFKVEKVILNCGAYNDLENEIFRDVLGDYLAIGKTDKTLLYEGSEELKSQHAGYTDDEILVPLIVIDCI